MLVIMSMVFMSLTHIGFGYIEMASEKIFSPGEEAYIHIQSYGIKKVGVRVYEFEVFPTRSEQVNYLNIRILEKIDNLNNNRYSEYYFIAKYEIKDKNLDITYLEESGFKEAIKKGRLKGTIKGDNFMDEVIFITDNTENVLEFIESSKDEGLFETFGEYQLIEN